MLISKGYQLSNKGKQGTPEPGKIARVLSDGRKLCGDFNHASCKSKGDCDKGVHRCGKVLRSGKTCGNPNHSGKECRGQ